MPQESSRFVCLKENFIILNQFDFTHQKSSANIFLQGFIQNAILKTTNLVFKIKQLNEQG